MSQGASRKLHIIGFLMTVGMVLYHFSYFQPASFSSALDEEIYIRFTKLFEQLGVMGMSYFFSATGFLLYRGMTKENVRKKLKSRIYSLLLPYCIWNGLYYLFYLIIFGKNYLFGVKGFLERVIFLPFDAPLWYVLVVFVYALAAPVVLKLKPYRKLVLSAALIFVITSYVLLFGREPFLGEWVYGWYVRRLLRYLPNYILGAVFGLYLPEIIEKSGKKLNGICALLWGLSVIGCLYFFMPEIIVYTIQRIQPVLLWMAVPRKEKKCGQTSVFRAAFMVYALHALGIFFMEHIADDWFVLNGLGAVAVRFIGGIGIITGILAVWLLMKKIAPKTLKVLTGSRG